MRTLFLRLFGLIFLAAFLSLYVQVEVLIGSRGLLPIESHLEAVRRAGEQLREPTIFWLGTGDATLQAAAIAGAMASLGLVFMVAPRLCLVASWLLYLSFVNAGQEFFSFQWDNLLLETAFFTLFITPGGWRPRASSSPHPLGVFLMCWLLFRLNFESGVAKLLGGDPSWRDLTALASYYETAPLPTWVGWYAHQMPLWAHRGSSAFTLGVEIGLAPLIFAPGRRLRLAVFLVMTAMQLSILATANYGFFNHLSIALGLFLLDDGHLAWVGRRFGRRTVTVPPHPRSAWSMPGIAATMLVVAVTVVPFLPFMRTPAGITRALDPVRQVLAAVRSINAYHLFVHMTRVRREVVIEGSADGSTWRPYEFRYKPGDPERAPPLVAPHQPRVDFQLWFLTLGRRISAPYFDTLLRRLIEDPVAVAALFADDPFVGTSPAFLRVAVYRYRFSDVATRRASGAWWSRELLGYGSTVRANSLRGRGG